MEEAVHRHLDDQLAFLDDKDDELFELIRSIQVEELQHLDQAKANIASKGRWSGLLWLVIAKITDLLIWLSTWGDSSKMKFDLGDHK